MAISDIFKGKQYKASMEELQKENENLKSLLTPELQNAHELKEQIDALESLKATLQTNIDNLHSIIMSKNSEIIGLNQDIINKRAQLVTLDDDILVQEFGLYKANFEFASSLDYKEQIANIRAQQKEMIKSKTAVAGNTNWRVNGSLVQGRKMVTDFQKLLLRAFNTECDEIISNVKYINFDASLNKIHKSAETISKLGATMGIFITQNYLGAKVRELRLAFEYQQKKQEEKEEQKAAREELREAARLQKEIEEQRKKIEKEHSHYQTALDKIQSQLANSPKDTDLLAKKAEIEQKLSDINKAIKDIDYREANQKAGYVYIISNIGAFGENVYKIGMTRRLNPQDRIDELGDASVPFKFDIHAMIFSDDAPALEAALHRAFESKKLNMVNQRREFFNVTLDEIKEVVKKNFDKTVEFVDVPDAEQFRISQKMRQQ